MQVSIIVIGDEILIGQVTDTNSGWIARHINPLGWNVKSIRTVADDAEQIKAAVVSAMVETDLVLTTGGLGPTKDDITKETLRQVFGGDMIYDKMTEANILKVVEKRHLTINPLTKAQAYVPSSCRVIQNKVGTAPIMWFEQNGKVLVSMPGVPFETEAMMQTEVIPQLKEFFCDNEFIVHRTFVVINYSESVLAMKLDQFEEEKPEYIKLAYLPKPGVIRLRLSGMSHDEKQLNEDIDKLTKQLHDIIGEDIVSYEDKTLAEIVGNILNSRNLTISTAESCTGGNIAHRITEIAGSSKYYNGSVVSYANEVKENLLNVSSIATEGAVSESTVREMCQGVAKLIGTECSIAVSGIAGPDGGSPQKPVGTVWIAVKCNNTINAKKFHFAGDRERVIDRATTASFIMMIETLNSKGIV